MLLRVGNLLFLIPWVATAFAPWPTTIKKHPAITTTSSTAVFGVKKKKSAAASMGFDMEDLKKRIAEETNPYSDIFSAQEPRLLRPDTVHMIVFPAQDGIHTIEYPKGSGSNLVLAFESEEACDKFAQNLKAQQFFDPQPQEVTLDDLESFCERLGVYCQVVPKGVEVIPPQERVKKLGNNPSLREQQSRLNYLFFGMTTDADDDAEEEGLLASTSSSSSQPVGSWE